MTRPAGDVTHANAAPCPCRPAGGVRCRCAPVADVAPGYVQTFAKHHMIAAANPLAAQAGLEMLRAGGSAVDAAIATQMVLGLVEPESSGIGGGAFMLVYNPKTKQDHQL